MAAENYFEQTGNFLIQPMSTLSDMSSCVAQVNHCLINIKGAWTDEKKW